MALCGNMTGCDPWIEYIYGNSTVQPTFAADPDIAGAGVGSTLLLQQFELLTASRHGLHGDFRPVDRFLTG